MNRRAFLGGLAAGVGVSLAGCSDGDADPTTPTPDWQRTYSDPSVRLEADALADAWGFSDVVDLAAAGADPSGGTPIDPLLDDMALDDTLVSLPPGRYAIEDEVVVGDGARVGLVGDGATVVPADGFNETLFGLGWPEPASEVLVAGLTFDFRAEDTASRPLFARADDRIHARDLSVRGTVDVQQDQFRFDVTSPSGSAVVERLSLPDGALPDTGVTAIEVGDDNLGDIEFRDCNVAGFPDNGLYADLPEGRVRVLGGTFVNNGIAGVRIEGNEALVRGVHVRCDTNEGGANMRGIRLRDGRDVYVEDCVVELREVTTSDGAVVFSSDLGSATVRNCALHVDADGVNAIRVKSGGDDGGTNGPFRCENITITGSAADGAAVQAADRTGCTFRNVCITQSGANRDGIYADNVQGALHDTHIAVTGDPFHFENARISRENVTVDRTPRGVSTHRPHSC